MSVFQELMALDRPLGDAARILRIGEDRLLVEGLDTALAGALDRRFGPYLEPAGATADFRLSLFRRDGPAWLVAQPGEIYRIESVGGPGERAVVSYHFALCENGGPRRLRAALCESPDEPAERVADNVLRVAVARLAVERGGFALHGAGVLRGGRAWIFAGPSNAGKTTAVGLSAPAENLGDDFAVVVPGEGGWRTPGLPFDNAAGTGDGDVAEARPGPHPLACVLRLVQADRHRFERPAIGEATAALMGAMAFPWAFPDETALLLDRATQVVIDGRFARLHFRRDSAFWELLDPPPRP